MSSYLRAFLAKLLKIACLAFTESGIRLAENIQSNFSDQVDLFTKGNYKKHLMRIFEEYQGIVFLSSTGIAVRLSAPFLRDKTRDPAVVVVDDLGRYAISLISGHLGGANALTRQIADILRCQPIITTASDGRGFEALDLFAQKHGLVIENLHDLKVIAGMMADGKPIRVISEISPRIDYPHVVGAEAEGCIYVTSQNMVTSDLPYCVLRPKNLHIGIGCRKGKSTQAILDAISRVFREHHLSLKSLRSLATIEAKRSEVGILEAGKQLGVTMRIFSYEEIHQVQDRFASSRFVRTAIGVTAVSEPCAYLAGGKIIVGKTAIHGITIAVAKEEL